MKALTLIMAENYPFLTAYWETTNFGDQLITFVQESIDGTKTNSYLINHEGEHLFNKKALIQAYRNIIDF